MESGYSIQTARSPVQAAWDKSIPAVFVLLWSTGYISARLGLPYIEPFTFLTLRFGTVALLLAIIAHLTSAPWPTRVSDIVRTAIAGCLIHGVFLGSVFVSVSFKLPSSVAALIVGTQPLLTAIGAALFLNERLTRAQWFGQALGIMGVALVVERKMSLDIDGIAGVLACLVALAAMTIGTLWQKRFCPAMDLRSGSAIQFAAAAAITGLASLVVETHHIVWAADLFIALGSLIFISSLGATTLLYILIRRGAASRVSSLFYLVPIVAAIFEFLIFREEFGPITVLGMALASTGVMMITRAPRQH